jgi:palmitoyl-protein thioesterase
MYTNLYQKHISIAGYWRDPKNIENYIQKSSYLSLFNNEKWSENSTMYITNIKKLKNIVFIWSAKDEIINPPESGKFSFFDNNLNVVSIFDTELYKNDLLGLRYLNEQNKMHIYETSCTHVQHKDPICFEELYVILKKYL